MNRRTKSSDAELAQKAAHGDRVAFDTLYRRHFSDVARFAAKIVGVHARDAAQDCFIEAYLSLARLQKPHRFKSWLLGIALNICRGRIRKNVAEARAWNRLSGGWYSTPHGVSPDEHLLRAYELERIQGALASLPPALRRTIELRYLNHFSVRETSRSLDVSESAVKVRLHRARSRLREELQEKSERRRKKMREIEVLDVISDGIVLFVDWDKTRVFPVFMSRDQVQSIAVGLSETENTRPLTFQFMANVMEELGGKVERIVITALGEDGTFYARVSLNNGKSIDARPSDAVNLALVAGAPLFAEDDVLEKTGIEVTVDEEKRKHYQKKKNSKAIEEIKMLAMIKMQREGLKRYVQALFNE